MTGTRTGRSPVGDPGRLRRNQKPPRRRDPEGSARATIVKWELRPGERREASSAISGGPGVEEQHRGQLWLLVPVIPALQDKMSQSGIDARHEEFLRSWQAKYPDLVILGAPEEGRRGVDAFLRTRSTLSGRRRPPPSARPSATSSAGQAPASSTELGIPSRCPRSAHSRQASRTSTRAAAWPSKPPGSPSSGQGYPIPQ